MNLKLKLKSIALALPLLFLPACASSPQMLGAVGPAPGAPQAKAETGGLIIYTATEAHVVGDGPAYNPHSGYVILNEAGQTFKYVPNHTGVMDERPAVVVLPSGRYTVNAQAQGYGRVAVPVVINTGRLTKVHLDGDWTPGPSSTNSQPIVRLSGGQAVGWKAD